MPSRQPPLPAAPPYATTMTKQHPYRSPSLLFPLIAGGAAAISFLLFLAVMYRKLSRNKTTPVDLKPQRFSYSHLRRATASFSPSNKLGQGGFGSVYRGTLISGQEIAVKLMDSGSLQGEREFQNELSLAGKIESDRVVALLGFCCERRRRRLLLVYEFMQNRSLQDALLYRKCPELMVWKKRFGIAMGIAKGLEFLHTGCDPPIIHGDIKPSNILLGEDFSAKIADFGLARLKAESKEPEVEPETSKIGLKGKKKRKKGAELETRIDVDAEEGRSIMEENESVTTAEEGKNGDVLAEPSPENVVSISLRSPETDASPKVFCNHDASETVEKSSVSEGCFDKVSMDSNRELPGNKKGCRKKSLSGRDWWWKQDNSNSDSVKDYVLDWIGTEIKRERPKSDWIAENSKPAGKSDRKKQKRRLEWWTSLDEDRIVKKGKKDKNRQGREWWREEFCEELSRKKRKGGKPDELWWDPLESGSESRRKRKNRSGSRSSVDGWIEGFSGELRFGRRNSRDWASGEIPKSGGVSSTPSMRGTVCYVAPEYTGSGFLSEKCDIYSFGVLLLVLVSGRRPLQVTASPMAEFERANLISWARHLARSGKLLDLVDPSIGDFDPEQALLCITVALFCLQRLPSHRPTITEVVRMLSGEAEPPHLPFEFSPSPPSCGFPVKSRRKNSSHNSSDQQQQKCSHE